LSDKTSAQHEFVRDDLSLFRVVAKQGQKIAAETHAKVKACLDWRKDAQKTGEDQELQGGFTAARGWRLIS
jgi:hypothetical protein